MSFKSSGSVSSLPTGNSETNNLRVVFWGTYDLSKPRTRILRDSLHSLGVEVIEIHHDVWSSFPDKSQARRVAILASLFKTVFAYPRLLLMYLKAPSHEAVIVPYLGQLDILILKPFAFLRRKPLIWDMFISLYDTVVFDRRMAGRVSPLALTLRMLEWLGCRMATKVVLDTDVHAKRIASLLGAREEAFCALPVGVEPGVFSRLPPSENSGEPIRVLFYGQLIPLHGVEVILKAALSERGRQHRWHIIGKGQDSSLVKNLLSKTNAPHIKWQEWCDYDKLLDAIRASDVCLGIFGESEKAASVIPNKVYQCLFAGRSVVTRQSEAISEFFPKLHPGLYPVKEGDSNALLDGIDEAKAQGFPAFPEDQLTLANPQEIGRKLVGIIQSKAEPLA